MKKEKTFECEFQLYNPVTKEMDLFYFINGQCVVAERGMDKDKYPEQCMG